jgi:hypothetical protein
MSSAVRLSESHVDRPDAQLGIHQLALGDRSVAHRLRLGAELPQHRVALDRDVLCFGQREAITEHHAWRDEGEKRDQRVSSASSPGERRTKIRHDPSPE